MKKEKPSGYHIQHQIFPKYFLGKNGEKVYTHGEALVFATSIKAADFMIENRIGEMYAIIRCNCPPSEQ